MRIRASAIIRHDGKIILVKRQKGYDDKKVTYFVIPGGGVEEGEDITTATMREIDEEIGITVRLTDECFKLKTDEKEEYFFVADYESGEIGTGMGPEFTSRDYDKYGSYEIITVGKDEIDSLNLMPPEAKEYILKNIENIF